MEIADDNRQMEWNINISHIGPGLQASRARACACARKSVMTVISRWKHHWFDKKLYVISTCKWWITTILQITTIFLISMKLEWLSPFALQSIKQRILGSTGTFWQTWFHFITCQWFRGETCWHIFTYTSVALDILKLMFNNWTARRSSENFNF